MSNNQIFSFLIFVIYLFTTCATFNKDLVMCGDCTEDNEGTCEIDSEPGYYVQPDIWSQSRDLTSLYPPVTSNLDVCMPSDMKIDAKDGSFKYICVWSRNLGCHVLTPKTDTNVACAMCKTRDFDDIPNCPCKRASKKGKKDKDKDKKSGSTQLYTGSMNIMIVAVGLVLIGLKP
ncbi:hypothetical protein KR084_001957 [Drosophila pseudotakahashii]|nr:hypothetical protein KR084_001957 [Drosophila pseudotakahashii]